MSELITSLCQKQAYSHAVDNIKLVETHISWILLTGPFAYKIKKPVNFGFLDYTCLSKRQKYCGDELKFNQALAQEIYISVVPITKNGPDYKVEGEGEAIEYAVKMKQFSNVNLFSNLISTQDVTPELIKCVAEQAAYFHMNAKKATANSAFGTPKLIFEPVTENFNQISPLLTELEDIELLSSIKKKAYQEFERLQTNFLIRKQANQICECHGDLHLGNITLIDSKPVIFDCVEFNENFRWLDPMADIAFMMMDLYYHKEPKLAGRFISTYLEETGDYAGIKLLNFYISYRAMVRAKIKLLQISRTESKENNDKLLCGFRAYANLASSILEPQKPVLFITFGVSGSGKSTIAETIVDNFSAIRIRSDVERKRLFYKLIDDKTNLYSDKQSELTYHHLEEMAHTCLDAGHSVVIDAACLKQSQRNLFINLARSLQINFIILECTARPDTLEYSLIKRQASPDNVSDATVSVLHQQLKEIDDLTVLERYHTVTINYSTNNQANNVVALIRDKLNDLTTKV